MQSETENEMSKGRWEGGYGKQVRSFLKFRESNTPIIMGKHSCS